LGAPIGGYIASHFGVRAPLEVAATLFLAVTVVALFLPREGRVRGQVPLGEIRHTLGREPRLLVPFLFHLVDRYTVGLFIILFPLYLAHLGTEDPAVRGRYLAFYLLPFALLQYFTGRLSERTGPFPPLLIGSVLYGSALCAVGFADLFVLWPVMVALGVLAAVMFPPSITLVSRWSTPATRGSAMGGFNLAGSLGFAAGPVVGVAVYDWLGFAAAFATAGGLEILAAAVAFVWWRQHGGGRDDD
jgi:MFS family permease